RAGLGYRRDPERRHVRSQRPRGGRESYYRGDGAGEGRRLPGHFPPDGGRLRVARARGLPAAGGNAERTWRVELRAVGHQARARGEGERVTSALRVRGDDRAHPGRGT